MNEPSRDMGPQHLASHAKWPPQYEEDNAIKRKLKELTRTKNSSKKMHDKTFLIYYFDCKSKEI
jgi:hypothetical protein